MAVPRDNLLGDHVQTGAVPLENFLTYHRCAEQLRVLPYGLAAAVAAVRVDLLIYRQQTERRS